ncbi:hypothetical protein EBR96_05015 [bacterium]|nr:hypothetical protein [bacterium]
MNEFESSLTGIVDRALQNRLRSGESLAAVAADLFCSQVDAGVISTQVIDQIRIVEKIESEPGGSFFLLQHNEARQHRGVSDRVHPNPPFTISFKGGMPCFCCPEVIHYQWPNERGILIRGAENPLLLLPNIAPIFAPHFTIVSLDHRPQNMDLVDLVAVAKQFEGGWVVQNGPDAGATNPFHYHLQAFFFDLPFESDSERYGVSVCKTHPGFVIKVTHSDLNRFTDYYRRWTESYLNLSQTRRVNLFVRYNGIWEGYIALRDTRYRTELYRSGQPGYAEMAGIVSPSNPAGYAEWKLDGWARYTRLVKEVTPSDAATLNYINLIDSGDAEYDSFEQ